MLLWRSIEETTVGNLDGWSVGVGNFGPGPSVDLTLWRRPEPGERDLTAGVGDRVRVGRWTWRITAIEEGDDGENGHVFFRRSLPVILAPGSKS